MTEENEEVRVQLIGERLEEVALYVYFVDPFTTRLCDARHQRAKVAPVSAVSAELTDLSELLRSRPRQTVEQRGRGAAKRGTCVVCCTRAEPRGWLSTSSAHCHSQLRRSNTPSPSCINVCPHVIVVYHHLVDVITVSDMYGFLQTVKSEGGTNSYSSHSSSYSPSGSGSRSGASPDPSVFATAFHGDVMDVFEEYGIDPHYQDVHGTPFSPVHHHTLTVEGARCSTLPCSLRT